MDLATNGFFQIFMTVDELYELWSRRRAVLKKSKRKKSEKIIIIDIRDEADYERSHIDYHRAIHIQPELIRLGVYPSQLQKYLADRKRENEFESDLAVNDQKTKRVSHLDIYLERFDRYENSIIILDSSTTRNNVTENSRASVLRMILSRWEPDGCPDVVIVDGGFNAVLKHHPEMLTDPKVSPDESSFNNLFQPPVAADFEYPLWYYRCWYRPEDIPADIQLKIDQHIKKVYALVLEENAKYLNLPPYYVLVEMVREYGEVLLERQLRMEKLILKLNNQLLNRIFIEKSIKIKREYATNLSNGKLRREQFVEYRQKFETNIATFHGIEKYASKLYPIKPEDVERRILFDMLINDYKKKIIKVQEEIQLREKEIEQLASEIAEDEFQEELKNWIELLEEQRQLEHQHLNLYKQLMNFAETYQTLNGSDEIVHQSHSVGKKIEHAWSKRFDMEYEIACFKSDYRLADPSLEDQGEEIVQDIERIRQQKKAMRDKIEIYIKQVLCAFHRDKALEDEANGNVTEMDIPVATVTEIPGQDKSQIIEDTLPTGPSAPRAPVAILVEEFERLDAAIDKEHFAESYDPDSPVGLVNFGATCYMNTIIQCLNSIEKFSDFFFNYRGTNNSPLANRLSDVIQKIKIGDRDNVEALKQLKDEFSKIHTRFKGHGVQQDCHEFLLSLLNSLHEEMKNKQGISIISELFYGEIRRLSECKKCGRTSESESMTGLMLPIREDGHCTLRNCLNDNFQTEEFRCNDCQEVKKKWIKIEKIPEILIVQLNRFIVEGQVERKNCLPVDVPIKNLNLKEFMGETAPEEECLYDLRGMAVHHGKLKNEGHYTALCKDGKKNWHKFNDKTVTKTKKLQNDSQQPDSTPYVLFYEKSTEHSS